MIITNERTSACCGSPAGRCSCHKVDRTVESVMDFLRSNPATSELFGTDRVQAPTPIPVFNWDFENEFARNDQQPAYRPEQPSSYDEPKVTFVTNNGGNDKALGLPEWDFEPVASVPVGNAHRNDGRPEPMPQYDWSF